MKCWQCSSAATHQFKYADDEAWKPFCGARQCGPVSMWALPYGTAIRPVVEEDPRPSLPFADLEALNEAHRVRVKELMDERDAVTAERDELSRLVNTPEVIDFVIAVQLEAAHQRKRWPSEHDAGKTDADWFWLIGYLAGKALHNPIKDPASDEQNARELQLHRIITVAAAAANWHAAKLGKTNMRPGIETPAGEP